MYLYDLDLNVVDRSEACMILPASNSVITPSVPGGDESSIHLLCLLHQGSFSSPSVLLTLYHQSLELSFLYKDGVALKCGHSVSLLTNISVSHSRSKVFRRLHLQHCPVRISVPIDGDSNPSHIRGFTAVYIGNTRLHHSS